MRRHLPMVAALVVAASITAARSAAQDGVRCAPGKVPMCLCACVEPDPRNCQTLPATMPATAAIRSHLMLYAVAQAPDTIKPLVTPALSWSDTDLDAGFATALVAARCHSGGAAGPANPAAVPAAEVKSWVLAVLSEPQASPALRALVPIVEALPPAAVRIAYLRAVELRRGLDYGALGK